MTLAVRVRTVAKWVRRFRDGGVGSRTGRRGPASRNRPPVVARPPVQRDEWPRPGDLTHLDIKPFGPFRRESGIGYTGIPTDRPPGTGWEYVPVARQAARVHRCRRSHARLDTGPFDLHAFAAAPRPALRLTRLPPPLWILGPR